MVNVKTRAVALVGAILLLAVGLVVAMQLRSSSEDRLLTFGASARELAYEPPEAVDDAVFQLVLFSVEGDSSGLGLRKYRNPGGLSAEAWLRERWDPERVLALETIVTLAGRGVIVRDFSKWLEAHEEEPAFPVLAVLAVGDSIVVIDRLNGLPIDVTLAETLIREVRR